MASLWLAEDAAALHRVLLFIAPIRPSASHVFEPMALLRKHHESEPEASAITTMLLVTDLRWRGAAGPLIREVEDSGILSEEELDSFADMFLAADDTVFYTVPEEWWGSGITIDFGPQEGAEAIDDGEVIEEDMPHEPVVVRRIVWDPLRRWAAIRVVRTDARRWEIILARAKELNARIAASIVAGLVDGIASLEHDAQAALIDLAVGWPQKGVRRQALELIAERDGPDRAYALGKEDSSKAVREWAPRFIGGLTSAKRDDMSNPTISRRCSDPFHQQIGGEVPFVW